jgi:hypothetical protein
MTTVFIVGVTDAYLRSTKQPLFPGRGHNETCKKLKQKNRVAWKVTAQSMQHLLQRVTRQKKHENDREQEQKGNLRAIWFM